MGFGKKITSLILLVAMLSALLCTGASATDSPDILAQSAVFMETTTGTILYEKDMDTPRGIDKIVKVMTVLVALDAVKNGDVAMDASVTIGEGFLFDIPSNGVTLTLQPGEILSLRDLLYAIFLADSSESCNIVAAFICGDVSVFIERMNKRAAALGCTNTHYADTHGENSGAQYSTSTAYEQAKIMQEAMSNAAFAEIAATLEYTIEATNMSGERNLRVSNSLLREGSKYYYSYALGGKTSASYENLYGYASMAKRDDMTIVAVVLGAAAVVQEDQSTLMRNLSETARIYDWCFRSHAWSTVLSGKDLVASVPVSLGDGADSVNLRPAVEIRALLPANAADSDFTRDIVIYSVVNNTPVVAPVASGDLMGEVKVYYKDKLIGSSRLVADTSVGVQHVRFIEQKVKDFFGQTWVKVIIALFFLLIAVYLALVIRYNVIRRARIKRVREAQERLKRDRGGRE